MSTFHLILLAIIQGVTEFLPVSSSGHLILLPKLTGSQDQGLVIDVAVHLGTLGAVILFFRKDVGHALGGLGDLARGAHQTQNARLAVNLFVASLPVCIAGALLYLSGMSPMLRSTAVIGWAMLGFGIVLWWADRRGGMDRTDEDWTLRAALTVGLWQVLALIPGTSRSGITITGARHLGFDRESAARFAMLMSIPVILASALLLGGAATAEADVNALKLGAIAALFAFFAALAALGLMMRLLKSVSFTPYVIYRIALGAILLIYAYS